MFLKAKAIRVKVNSVFFKTYFGKSLCYVEVITRKFVWYYFHGDNCS